MKKELFLLSLLRASLIYSMETPEDKLLKLMTTAFKESADYTALCSSQEWTAIQRSTHELSPHLQTCYQIANNSILALSDDGLKGQNKALFDRLHRENKRIYDEALPAISKSRVLLTEFQTKKEYEIRAKEAEIKQLEKDLRDAQRKKRLLIQERTEYNHQLEQLERITPLLVTIGSLNKKAAVVLFQDTQKKYNEARAAECLQVNLSQSDFGYVRTTSKDKLRTLSPKRTRLGKEVKTMEKALESFEEATPPTYYLSSYIGF